jgi:hypothetical protein
VTSRGVRMAKNENFYYCDTVSPPRGEGLFDFLQVNTKEGR